MPNKDGTLSEKQLNGMLESLGNTSTETKEIEPVPLPPKTTAAPEEGTNDPSKLPALERLKAGWETDSK